MAGKAVNVIPIKQTDFEPWLLEKHYARRMCPVSFAFGAYVDGVLRGVVTFGVPMSPPLRSGLLGDEFSSRVLELNRLCCEPIKNLASELVGRSMRMLPKPSAVVSYADTAQGHVGYVYQACNFLYTGLSANRTDWKIKGLEHLHCGTIADKSIGADNRAQWMRDTYGERFYTERRSRKHRYVFFCGSKAQKAAMMAALKYVIEPYPKGDTMRYDAGCEVPSQFVIFL